MGTNYSRLGNHRVPTLGTKHSHVGNETFPHWEPMWLLFLQIYLVFSSFIRTFANTNGINKLM